MRDNWETLFSGVGGALLLWLLGLVVHKRAVARQSQKQRGGSDSVNLQAGRDIVIEEAKEGRSQQSVTELPRQPASLQRGGQANDKTDEDS